jgi:hypothetical protein
MTVPTVSCTNCGKNFTTDDLRGTSCKYCGTLLAHHARAQQQVAVINQMMADRNGNGIPDAYEGLIANAQANAMNQAFGTNPYPYGAPMGGPPMMGGPLGPGAPMGMNPMMGPAAQVHAAHVHAANMHVQHAAKTMSKVMIAVVVGIVLVTVLTVGIGIASALLLR